MAKGCKDCEPGSKRPTPHPGPRCATHHRAFKRQQKANNHDRMVVKVYGIEPGEYERMYEEQGGVCFICRRANGRTKRLAVDHDHDTGLVRGLLCGPCNKFVGYVRNSADAFRRGAAYLDRAEIKNGATSAA
jgi:hypothetical protein